MSRHRIPKNAGRFETVQARSGDWAAWNNRRGKNRVWIVCRDKAHAEEVCERLNEKDCPREIWV